MIKTLPGIREVRMVLDRLTVTADLYHRESHHFGDFMACNSHTCKRNAVALREATTKKEKPAND